MGKCLCPFPRRVFCMPSTMAEGRCTPPLPAVLALEGHAVKADMNRQECRTKRIDSVCGVTWIPLCARNRCVIKWGRGEGETLSIHVVWTQCALGLGAVQSCVVCSQTACSSISTLFHICCTAFQFS